MSVLAELPSPTTKTPQPRHALRSLPNPVRWTLSLYRELGKTGLFRDVKTMLIDGEIHIMPLPNPPHSTSLSLVEEWLRSIPLPGYHFRNQTSLDIGTRNDPGPDLAVVPGKIRDYSSAHPTSAVWVIEVSDSTLFFDTTTKAELYATAKVAEYWVLDLENRRLLVYRDPEALPAGLGATAYRTHLIYTDTESVTPLISPGALVTVGELLP